MRYLTLIFGTVGSGKTGELLKIISRLNEHNSRCRPSERKKFLVFKPAMDTRNKPQTLASRSGHIFHQATAISDASHLLEEIKQNKPDIIIIDECQFFETELNNPQYFIWLVKELLDTDQKQVILCGLIQNCHGEKFEILSSLCHEADEIINPHTTCRCGQVASRSQRLQMGYPTPITDPVFLVDDTTSQELGYSYEPRCNNCWELPNEIHPHLAAFRQIVAENQALKKQLPT